MEEEQEDFIGPKLPVNPFVLRQTLSTYDKLKMLVTVFLLPFRLLLFVVTAASVTLSCTFASWGRSMEEMQALKYNWWRQMIWDYGRKVLCVTGFAMGFQWVEVKGQQASVREAPILVMAPHSSFIDAVAIFNMQRNTSIITKGEYHKAPVIGVVLTYIKTLFFWRDDPNSRHNLIKEILQRSAASDIQAQVTILPEGTCTTRSCLIPFKPGAFNPRLPVQPVCLRYPNCLDTVTWTWVGPGVLRQALLSFLQFHVRLQMDYLPVYHPSQEERDDPKLYAENVRILMAKALGLPLTDYGLLDCRLLLKMGVLDFGFDLKEIKQIWKAARLSDGTAGNDLISSWMEGSLKDVEVSQESLGALLGMPSKSPHLGALCRLLSMSPGEPKANLELCAILLSWMGSAHQCTRAAEKIFQVLDPTDKGLLTLDELSSSLVGLGGLTASDISVLFHQLDRDGRGQATAKNVECLMCLKPEFIKFFAICCQLVRGDKVKKE